MSLFWDISGVMDYLIIGAVVLILYLMFCIVRTLATRLMRWVEYKRRVRIWDRKLY
jgi:hypothetical protein